MPRRATWSGASSTKKKLQPQPHRRKPTTKLMKLMEVEEVEETKRQKGR